MAEIPSSDSMQRALPGAPGSRPSLRYQSTPDTGVGLISRALERAGATLDEVDAKRQARDDRIAEAKASTALARGLFQAYRETEDNDYGTQVRRFSERATKSIDEAAGLISNPEMRDLFMARAEGQVVDWTNRAHTRALKVEGAARIGEFEADLPDMLERASALDEKGATQVLGELNQRLQALVDIQAISPKQMQDQIQKFGAEYAETRIRAMGPSDGYEELGKGDKGLGKFLPPLARERLRESLEHDAAVETSLKLVDAAGGRRYSEAELRAMAPEVRVLVQKLEDQATARVRGDVSWSRSTEAYLRGRAERDAIEMTPQFVGDGASMTQSLKSIDDSDMPEFQKQIARNGVLRHFQVKMEAEAAAAREKFAEVHDDILSGRITVARYRMENPKDWEALSPASKQMLIDSEGQGAAATKRFTEKKMRDMAAEFKDITTTPEGATFVRQMGIGYLRARTFDDDFVTIAESLGWGSEKLVVDAKNRLAEAGSTIKADPEIVTTLLNRGLGILGENAKTPRGRLFDERFRKEIARRERQSVLSGGAGSLTFEQIEKIRDDLLEQFELTGEYWGTNTRRAFEIDEPGEMSRLTRAGSPIDLKIVNDSLLKKGTPNPTAKEQDEELQDLFESGKIFELRRQYRSAPGGR